MIIFGKKQIARKNGEDINLFRYRDSATGLRNREFAFKEYERLKHIDECSAVMVRLSSCDGLPYYKASALIKESGALVARICGENIARIENGDFLILSTDALSLSERLSFFLGEIAEGDEKYAVVCDSLDQNEDFDTFLRRIQRHVGIAEMGNVR